MQFNMEVQFQFYLACGKGNIMLAKKLLYNNPQIDISFNNEEAFRLACFNGYLEIVKWLLEIRPKINISAQDEEAFIWACANGHLEISKWLLEIRSQINIFAHDDFAFKGACSFGHLEVGEWLQKLNPYLYKINYNTDGKYMGYYVRTKKEARWEQTKYLVWLSSPHSPNKQCILYKLPSDISRHIIQNFI